MTKNLESYHSANDDFRGEWENLINEVSQSPRKKQTPSRRVSIDRAAAANRDRLIKEINDLKKDKTVVNWHEFNTAKDSKTKSDYWKKIIGSKIDLKLLDNPKYGKHLENIKKYLLDYNKWTKIVFDKGVKYCEIKDWDPFKGGMEFRDLITNFISKYGNDDISLKIFELGSLYLDLGSVSRNGNKLTKVYHELDKLN